MIMINDRIRAVCLGALFALMVTMPAFADDSEIYTAQQPKGARPNVLFIMDTSGSMDTKVEQSIAAYEPGTTYIGVCDDNYIYYSTSGTPPTCSLGSDKNRILKSSFVCNAASAALGTGGGGIYPAITGVRAAQLRRESGSWRWRKDSFNENDYVECQDDDGKHGLTAGTYYIANTQAGWSSTSNSLWSDLRTRYYFFSANYVNWRWSSGSSEVTRLQIVRDVALGLASSLQNVNLGLMRYSSDADGGYVVTPIGNIDDNRTKIMNDLKSFDPDDGNNGTPLSETYYEAALYLTGGAVDFGADSKPGQSTQTTAVSNGKYISPIQYTCQKNYIVYLTDGAPTVDQDAKQKIPALIGNPGGQCKADEFPPDHDSGYQDGDGICMDDLAAWLSSEDTDLNKDVDEKQNALTYMIGFGSGLSEKSRKYLDMIAKAGGTGAAYTAANVGTLTDALQSIFKNIQEDSGTFVTPSISVNAFNRSQTDQDLYFSLFKAANRTHWPGNLKKYKLSTDPDTNQDVIVDALGHEAVTATGKFATDARSFWSAQADGEKIEEGGAASKMPSPTNRVLYTSLAGNTLVNVDGNLIDTSKNNLLTDKVVGTGDDAEACSDACKNAVDWLRGVDVNDENKDVAPITEHKFMGDPLHGKPAVVTYGKLSDDSPDTTIYVPTNDGLLHAINASTGEELWAYMPPELLGRLGDLSSTDVDTDRSYGLDGDVRVLRMDVDQDGSVESGDRVWIFFGMRAGGNHYYAMDVTNRAAPKLLWNIGPDQLPQIGQTWSPPVVTRVNVKDTNDDNEKFVLIFGGGYDVQQESQAYSADTLGNRIYMVDASTGKRLWFAGSTGNSGTSPQPNLKLDDAGQKMNNSIPSRVTVIDTNGDLFADRMYVGDMGGRVWRFDIVNGNAPNDLVHGGVLATLGNGDSGSTAPSDNRRFYNAADVALIDVRGREPYYNIAIGSGYRGHPLNEVTHERFYSLHDDQPYVQLTQQQYKDFEPITQAELVDVTPGTAAEPPETARGWSLDMYARKRWAGEKVLSESVTVNNAILFTSFEPGQVGDDAKGACFPSTTNRAYAVSALTGKAILNFNTTNGDTVDDDDLYVEINQEGIVGDINVALRRRDGDPPGSPPTICLAGMHVLNKCVNVGGTVRTWWNRDDAH